MMALDNTGEGGQSKDDRWKWQQFKKEGVQNICHETLIKLHDWIFQQANSHGWNLYQVPYSVTYPNVINSFMMAGLQAGFWLYFWDIFAAVTEQHVGAGWSHSHLVLEDFGDSSGMGSSCWLKWLHSCCSFSFFLMNASTSGFPSSKSAPPDYFSLSSTVNLLMQLLRYSPLLFRILSLE